MVVAVEMKIYKKNCVKIVRKKFYELKMFTHHNFLISPLTWKVILPILRSGFGWPRFFFLPVAGSCKALSFCCTVLGHLGTRLSEHLKTKTPSCIFGCKLFATPLWASTHATSTKSNNSCRNEMHSVLEALVERSNTFIQRLNSPPAIKA